MTSHEPRLLLDTNILVHFIRDSPLWRHVDRSHRPLTTPLTPYVCVVTIGELRSLSIQRDWGEKKRDQMEFGLGYFRIKNIDDPNLIRTYAVLDAYAVSVGVTMGKNDLWIAATAVVTGATLLTTDRDFDLFAPRFLHRLWLDPNATTT